MKQLTSQEAIAFAESRVWLDWTHEQIVRLQLFQDKLCVPFNRFHEAIEAVLGRPVYTHEFGLNWNGIVEEYLRTRPAPTFDQIIEMIPEDKRVLIVKS